MFWGKDYSIIELSLRKCSIGKIIIFSLLVLILQVSAGAQETTTGPSLSRIDLRRDDRILILAPHPDDEVLGCGGIIQTAVKMKLPLEVVFLTYGDNNQWSFFVYRKHPVIMPKAVRKMGEIRRN